VKKGVYVGCFPQDLPLEARFELAKEAGFEGIEIRGDEETIGSDERLRELVELSRRTVPITSIMGAVGWRPSLTDPDEATRKKAVELFQQTIRAAAKVGAEAILVVPGVVNEQVSYAQAWQRSMAGIRAMAVTARDYGVFLGVENVWNKFLLSPLEMARFIDEIGHPQVGAYFDVGNVLNFGYPEQWIETLGPRIKKVHVKDFKTSVGNIGGFVQLLEGDVNWPAVIAALRKVGYDGYLTAEVPPHKHLARKGLHDLASTIGEIIKL
jgi:L-ribulose-5-phosphate 3-epimerase